MNTVDARTLRIYVIDGRGFGPFYVTYPRRLTDKQVLGMLLEHLAPYRKEAAAIERAFEKKHGMKPKELELRYERSTRELKKYKKWYVGSRYEQLDQNIGYRILEALETAGFSKVAFSTTWIRGEIGGDTGLLLNGLERVSMLIEREVGAVATKRAPRKKKAKKE